MILTRIGRTGALALATLLIAVTTTYALAWMYYVGAAPEAWLGIHLEYRHDNALILVAAVEDGTPAQRAGLRAGDRITAIDGRPLTTREPFYDSILRGRPGGYVRLTVIREPASEPVEVAVVLAARPPRSQSPWLQTVAESLLRLYPVGFVGVMAMLLLQRPQDRNAWLVSLLFVGFIAAAPLDPAMAHPWARRVGLAFKTTFTTLTPAFFYALFAVFPARSPLDRRLPALKIWFVGVGLLIGLPTAVSVAATGTWDPLARMAASREWQAVGLAGAVYGIAGFALGAASLFWDYRSAPDPLARRRTRVIVWGTVVSVTPFLLLQVLSQDREPYDVFPFWIWAPAVFALFLLPLSFAYAVVRYRVIEIPLLLQRSARYLLVQRGFILLVAALGLVASIGLALSFPRVAPNRPEFAVPAGLLAGVAFGLVLAWAGTSVRRGIGRRIDRAFFRNAYDARLILEDLAVQAARTTSRQELAVLLRGCLDEALRPTRLVVYMESRAGVLDAIEGDVPPDLTVLQAGDPVLQRLTEDPGPFVLEPSEGRPHPLPVLASLNPECVVPMTGRSGSLTGLLVLGPRRSGEPYSSEDRRLLASVCRQAGLALENMRLAEQMAERLEAERRAAQELAIAHEVQARLLPQQAPLFATLDFRGVCLQARAVGGDYFDFLDMGSGSLALIMADISGKGISAALLMANLQAHLRAQYLVARHDPAGLLANLDRVMFETTAANHFATLFFGRYDEPTRRLIYANCGHNPPLLLKAHGGSLWLAPTAPAVGLLPVWSCSIDEAALESGDTLIVYTDGLTEAMDEQGECFGEERLLALAERNVALPLDDFVAAIVEEVQRFSGVVQEDDLTLVVARGR